MRGESQQGWKKGKRGRERTLLHRRRSDLRKLDQRNVAKLLDLLFILDTLDHPRKVRSELNLLAARIDKTVHALVRRLANVETVVDLVLEGTHDDDSDERLVHDRLLVELGEEGVKVRLDELRLVVGGRVESGDGKTADTLRETQVSPDLFRASMGARNAQDRDPASA